MGERYPVVIQKYLDPFLMKVSVHRQHIVDVLLSTCGGVFDLGDPPPR